MAIRFECLHCKTGYEVADDLAGKMIMCRGCQKRGPVRNLTAPLVATAATATTAATASDPSRRNFVLIAVGVVGAIAGGAILSRVPWRRWFARSRRPPDGSNRRRGKRGGSSKQKEKEKQE